MQKSFYRILLTSLLLCALVFSPAWRGSVNAEANTTPANQDTDAETESPLLTVNPAELIAAKVNGDTEISLLELNFHAGLIFQQLTNMPAFRGDVDDYLNTTVPTKEGNDTLLHLILDILKSEIPMKHKMYDLAKEAGMELSEEDQAIAQQFMVSLQQQSANNQVSYETMLTYLFGPGATHENIQKLIEDDLLQSSYMTKLYQEHEVSEEEKAAEYEAHAELYDLYSFALVPLKDDQEISDDLTDALQSVDSLESFCQAVAPYAVTDEKQAQDQGYASVEDYLENTAVVHQIKYADLSEDFSDWLTDPERQAGDTNLQIPEEGRKLAIYFLERTQNTQTNYDSRHILIKQMGDSETDKMIAQVTAEAILQAYQAGEPGEENFADLATKYSNDKGSNTNGGLYEDIVPGSFVAPYEEFCLDQNTQVGDIRLVYADTPNYKGYHIIYFKGLHEENWLRDTEAAIRETKQNAMLDAIKAETSFEPVGDGLDLLFQPLAEAVSSENTSEEAVPEVTTEATTQADVKP